MVMRQYSGQLVQNQSSQRTPHVFDGSERILSMYLEMVLEEDKRLADSWEANADGVLIFAGLFSAAVATLISVSIQDIRPNPQDTSTFYLSNIYQLLADPNRSNVSLPSPPPFSPPTYAVWVNSLWFLSLVISISCALLAALLRQWARRYIRVTQPRFSAHARAHVHAYFAEGVEKSHLVQVAEACPTLLHISLFLFLAGLAVFLWNINLTIFKLVLSWVGVCTALYGYITFVQIFHHNSPYYTPLSSLAWRAGYGTPFVILWAIRWFPRKNFSQETHRRFRALEKRYHKFFSQGVVKTAEETARNLTMDILTRAFMRTFESLNDDDELELFFAGLPGFRNSSSNPLPNLTKEQIFEELTRFMARTFLSDILSEPVKQRRAIICAKTIDSEDFPEARDWVLQSIVSKDRYGPLRSTEIGHIVSGWGNTSDERISLPVQAAILTIVARTQRHDRDGRWFTLASNNLGVTETVLRTYDTHGDNLSLAILIHITRRQLNHLGKGTWPIVSFSSVLKAASKFNIQDTSSELQHKFCSLWNEIVLKARDGTNSAIIVRNILECIRDVFDALHQGTDPTPTISFPPPSVRDQRPSSYPLCNTPGHCPKLAPRTFAVSTLTSLHDKSTLTPPAGAPGPFSPKPDPFPIDGERPTDVPPMNNDISAPLITVSSRVAQQITIENLHIPAAPPVLPHAGATQSNGNGASARTIPHSAPEASTPTPPPLASITLDAANSPHCDLYCVPSPDVSDISSPPPPILALDNALPTVPQLSLDSPATQPDYGPPRPEASHSLIPATAPPAASHPLPTSAPDTGIANNGEGSTKAAWGKPEALFDPPSVNPTNTVAAPGHKPPLPTLPALTDVAASVPSQLPLDSGLYGPSSSSPTSL
ncbi:hypothetical protein H4582DRAFT_2134493 [Lactarius indigo]|nr:hypothetical protein H4582DRAFT_2134493 [Lactarius indigo]